jgi:mutual gliding-motility protein MglA
MPTVLHGKKEVLLKLVYYGPGLGGKTTNIEHIHANTRAENRGKLLTLNNEAERTLFCDLLPVALGTFKGYTVRLHLCTVPGQVFYDETRRVILRNVDGVVFVVDSQVAQLDNNIDSLSNLGTNLRLQGIDPERVPVVVQYNKRDLRGVMPVPELRAALKIPDGVPEIQASAKFGIGVFETLKTIVRECLRLVGNPKKLKEGRTPSILPGRRASMYPEALPVAAPISDLPKAPRMPSFIELDGIASDSKR